MYEYTYSRTTATFRDAMNKKKNRMGNDTNTGVALNALLRLRLSGDGDLRF